MGKVTRKRYGTPFKAKVTLEAIKDDLTLLSLLPSMASRLADMPTAEMLTADLVRWLPKADH